MASKKLKELALRASKNKLTANDINQIVLAIADNEQSQDSDIKNLKIADKQKGRDLLDIKEEYPLLPPEADDLQRAVRQKGVAILGGKRSNAYANKDLRKKVFQDIYSEIKRQYGLVNPTGRQVSYKKLKRKHLPGAFTVVEEYVPPIVLSNEIESENELGDIDD